LSAARLKTDTVHFGGDPVCRGFPCRRSGSAAFKRIVSQRLDANRQVVGGDVRDGAFRKRHKQLRRSCGFVRFCLGGGVDRGGFLSTGGQRQQGGCQEQLLHEILRNNSVRRGFARGRAVSKLVPQGSGNPFLRRRALSETGQIRLTRPHFPSLFSPDL
jgi:hypothetical protein